MLNLATLSADALKELSPEELASALDSMSPEAIERFRTKRSLPAAMTDAVMDYLEAHPEKRPSAKPAAPASKARALLPPDPIIKRPPAKTPAAARPRPAAAASTANGKPKPAPRPAPRKPSKSGNAAAAGLISRMLGQNSDGYIPFVERFKAWWYGTELQPRLAKPSPKQTKQPRPEEARAAIEKKSDPEDAAAWRVRILERVWGRGYTMPGGDRPLHEMAAMASLEPGFLVADVTAGLGGPARSLAAAHAGVVVHGYTFDPSLLDAARRAGVEETVSMFLLDPGKPSFDGERYDRIFARESLYLVPGRDRLLRFFADNLRGGGEIVFWDLIDNDPTRKVSAVKAWMNREKTKPVILTLSEHKRLMVEARLELRSAKDMTRSYRAMVEPAFRKLIKSLEEDPLPPAGVDALMEECDLWRHRLNALETGDIRLMRFHAARKQIRTLSGPV